MKDTMAGIEQLMKEIRHDIKEIEHIHEEIKCTSEELAKKVILSTLMFWALFGKWH